MDTRGQIPITKDWKPEIVAGGLQDIVPIIIVKDMISLEMKMVQSVNLV